MTTTLEQAQAVIRQLGTDKANGSAEIARLRAALEHEESEAREEAAYFFQQGRSGPQNEALKRAKRCRAALGD